jgi:hypothetical protein
MCLKLVITITLIFSSEVNLKETFEFTLKGLIKFSLRNMENYTFQLTTQVGGTQVLGWLTAHLI